MAVVLAVALALIASSQFQCDGAHWSFADIEQPALTHIYSGGARIMANAAFFSGLSIDAQRFILMHECGHVHGIRSEVGADDYAMARVSYSPSLANEICGSLEEGGQTDRCDHLLAAWPRLYVVRASTR